MTIFETLLVAHLIGDWLLQTEFEAMNKANGKFFNRALAKHCLFYTLPFAPVLWWFSASSLWLLLLYCSHMFIDRRWPVVWWMMRVKHMDTEGIKKNFWLVIAVDQVMHVLVLAVIAGTM